MIQELFSTAHAAPHTNTPTQWMWPMNINYFVEINFWAFIKKKVPFSRTHTYEHLETPVNEVNSFQPSLPVLWCTLQTREEFISDQQVSVLCLHGTFSSLASPLEPHLEMTWWGIEAETKAPEWGNLCQVYIWLKLIPRIYSKTKFP
jgi:hypothetical protein